MKTKDTINKMKVEKVKNLIKKGFFKASPNRIALRMIEKASFELRALSLLKVK